MHDIHYSWRTIINPFLYNTSTTIDGIIGHVSGRSRDIINIVYSDQSAVILSGAPRIGKTALLRYLQTPPTAEWSWRREVEVLLPQEPNVFNNIRFIQIDFAPLENIYQTSTEREIYWEFLKQCGQALQQIYQVKEQETLNTPNSIREFLRRMKREQNEIRCFVMLDNIDRLGIDTPHNTRAKTPQELGIALLDSCGALRTLVDFMDEFSNFGVILALESLPRSGVDAQFSQVSADLARFATFTMQAFTWDDTSAFLAQVPEQFGEPWARQFGERGGKVIFSAAEQKWIQEQAGTHPYILQQFCLHMFSFKQLRAERYDQWADIETEDKPYLIEQVKTQIITFLNRVWKRLQAALETIDTDNKADMKEKFYSLIDSLAGKKANETFTTEAWNKLETEIQYILSNEGIVRYDHFQPVHYPGALLTDYLTQKIADTGSVPVRQVQLIINFPEKTSEPILLSRLEYRILKVLQQQYPNRSTEEDLAKAGWSMPVESKTFSQRMYQLRKKLKGDSKHDVIMNHYGGFYSLPHPEWLQLVE